MPHQPDAKARRIVRACASAFRRDSSKIVFLVGAGVSVRSGLPTAWEFHAGLAKFLAFNAAAEKDVLTMLTTDYVASGDRPVRFEQTIAVFRELYDPALRLLQLFDDLQVSPNGLHDFIATHLSRGALATTTNFDSLIERACDRLRHPVVQMCSSRGSRDSPHRFDEARVDGGCLLKLHGTLRVRNDQPRLEYVRAHSTLGATLDAIGRGIGTPGLEPIKERCVRAALDGRILVVVGYSGSDDLDVLPSLLRTLDVTRGVIWIKHVDQLRPEILEPWDRRVPDVLRGLDNCVVVAGMTSMVLTEVLGAQVAAEGASPRPDVSGSLRQTAPYHSFRAWHRAVVIARLAEVATRTSLAARYYAAAARLAAKDSDVTDHAYSRCYALARLGHIHREAGQNAKALTSLRAARRIGRDHGFQTLLANVTVSIGNVYLRTGRLSEALRAYREALRVNRTVIKQNPAGSRTNRQNVATITSNIGIAFRKRGEYRLALRSFQASLAQARRLRDRDRIVLAVGNLGNAHYHLKNYDSAARAYDEAVALARTIGRRQNVAINLSNRATIARLQGEPEVAVAWLEEALTLDESLPYPEGEVDCLVERANNRLARGFASDALTDAERALRVAKRIGHIEGQADALRAAAEACAALGHRRRAAALRRKSLETRAILRG